MLVDDALMIHDRILPSLVVSEKYIYPTYAAIGTAWLVRFHREVLRADLLLLLLAGASLSSSIGLDVLEIVPTYAEDAPKLVGIASLLAHAVREALRRLEPGAAALRSTGRLQTGSARQPRAWSVR